MSQTNIEDILKEHSALQMNNNNHHNNKTFPYIVSKESFEKLIMNVNELSTNQTTQPQIIPGLSPRLTYQTSSDSSEFSDTPPQMYQNNDEAVPQRASVIQSTIVRKKSEGRRPIRRQRSVDESTMEDIPKEGDKNNNGKQHSEEIHTHPFTMVPCASFDAGKLENHKLKSRSLEYYPNMHKSKSLDMADDNYSLYSQSLPRQSATKHASFNYEEEAARRYFQGLHITTNSTHYPYGTLHNAPRDIPRDIARDIPRDIPRDLSRDSSFSESPKNSSPLGNAAQTNSPLRVLSEPQSVASLNQSEHSMQFNRPAYESTQNIQHKYSQRKAFSLNTAPYDLIHREKNLRRIFSEEIVPEQRHATLLTEKRSPVQHQTHMRRAASYDLAAYVRHRKLNATEKISGSVGNFHPLSVHQQSINNSKQSPQTSKIIFPEHDNVKDYKSIFIKQIDDESAHALNVMENSSLFSNGVNQQNNNNLDFVNYFTHSIQNLPFLDDIKRKPADQSPSTTSSSSKGKPKMQQQNSQDLLVGPYVYEPTTDDELAVCVTGLLTLPGSNEKRYPISVGELRRRIAPPEYLNKVDMISYVRLAKTSARELLEKHAIRPKHHSRKSKHSVISKMCEAECTELANGIKTLGEAYFPRDWLARESVNTVIKNTEEDERKRMLEEKLKKVEAAKEVLTDLVSLLETNKNEASMQNYNLATHSYGLQNLNNNIELITSLLDTQTNELQRSIDPTNHKVVNDTSSTNQITKQSSLVQQMSTDVVDSMETDGDDQNNDEKPRL